MNDVRAVLPSARVARFEERINSITPGTARLISLGWRGRTGVYLAVNGDGGSIPPTATKIIFASDKDIGYYEKLIYS